MNTLIIGNRNYSSWSLRAWLVLRRSGLPFQEHRIALDTPGYKEEIRRFSAAGKVPALILGEQLIWDSLAIAETLAEKQPGLWPDDPGHRALARCVSAEMHSGFAALREALPMNCRARSRRVELTSALEADIRRIDQIWQQCLTQSASSGWLFGRWSIADAMYAPVVFRFASYGIELSKAAAGYVQTQLADPDMQQWLQASRDEAEVIEREEVGQ